MPQTQQHDSIDRVHARIDELFHSFSDLRVIVEKSITQCDPCRKIVMGNGKDSLGDQITGVAKRVQILETTKSVSAWWAARIVAAAGVIATVSSVAVGIVFRIIGK